MVKKISIILISVIILNIFVGYSKKDFKINDFFGQENLEQSKDDINNKIIRFHVIANSDSKEDQELKLKVKNKVLEYIYPKLKNSKSLKESRKILIENNDAIKKIAEEEIRKNKYSYTVTTMLSLENFPIKTYGNITLPQGEYEAYRIIIGNGKGQNWWCVMFPPLCFVDVTKGEVSNKETEKCMKQVLTEEEYKNIDNTKKKEIKFRFKILDTIKDLLKK